MTSIKPSKTTETITEDSIELSSLFPDSFLHSPTNVEADDESFELDSCASHMEQDDHSVAMKVSSTRRRRYLRLLVLAIVVLVGFLISGLVYYFSRKGEMDQFQSEFQELAMQVSATLDARLGRKALAMSTMSVSLTSYALDSGSQWPMVTLPAFELKASNSLEVAGSHSLLFAPLVTNSTRTAWREYVSQQGVIPDHKNSVMVLLPDDIQTQKETALQTSFPVWQHTPHISPDEVTTADLMTSPFSSDTAIDILGKAHVVLGGIVALDSLSGPLSGYFGQLFGGKGNVLSNFFYPVFDSFKAGRTMVGVITMDLLWEDFFSDLTPVGSSEELVVIIRNQCGEEYTFRVTGGEANFVAAGDRHDSRFNEMEESFIFSLRTDSVGDSQNIGLDLGHCLYSAFVYPTENLQAGYLTYKPALYTVSVAFVFLLIFFVSLVYENRVEKVSESADEHRAIVANLFPDVVRDRLFHIREREREHRQKSSRTELMKSSSCMRLNSSFMKPKMSPQSPQNPCGESVNVDSEAYEAEPKPIADHFPETTVLFADIAGFTSWSANRKPEEVFTLLQALFNTFDKVAKRRDVFKVETIGDCYMAVTGVPKHQADHALLMTKFARECLHRLKSVLGRLAVRLGKQRRSFDSFDESRI